MAKVVTIRGTWSRKNTSRWEVYDYRWRIRKAFQRVDGSCDFTLPHHQKDDPSEETHFGEKSGSFTITLPIRSNYRTLRANADVVKRLAESVMLLSICRIPKLKVDYGRTTSVNNDDVRGII